MLEALANLPAQYADALHNVDFRIERHVRPRERARLGIGNATLYGLYHGIALTHRTSGYDRVLPDRITLYWGPLVRNFPDDGTLADQVRKTVYHEIGHYFGLDEDDLHDTSVR
jgi:predicted Zn-dependent protease with MMP-like domain